jgi:hypothetical protein
MRDAMSVRMFSLANPARVESSKVADRVDRDRSYPRYAVCRERCMTPNDRVNGARADI